MKKVIFFCVFSSWIMQTISKDVSEHDVTLLRYQLNGNISLNCNMTGKFEMAWYHQNPDSGRITILISAIGYRRALMTNYQNSRLTLDADTETSTVSLVISGLMESDSGLYFCGTRSVNSDMHFDKPIRLQIEDEISVKIGEELKLDVLLPNADKVQHKSRRSIEWKVNWSRTDGVQSERMTISDRNLIINNFTASDAGTYRVLDSEGEIMITVTVTESGRESKGKLDKPHDDKHNAVWIGFLTIVLPLCLCFWFWWFWNCCRFQSSKNISVYTGMWNVIPTKGSQFNKS